MRNEIIYEFPIDLDDSIKHDDWGDTLIFKQDAEYLQDLENKRNDINILACYKPRFGSEDENGNSKERWIIIDKSFKIHQDSAFYFREPVFMEDWAMMLAHCTYCEQRGYATEIYSREIGKSEWKRDLYPTWNFEKYIYKLYK